jgi:hypothetical protein
MDELSRAFDQANSHSDKGESKNEYGISDCTKTGETVCP